MSSNRDRILVVEDESATAVVIRRLLEKKFDARVTVAGDCSRARELLGSSEFDLVTLDRQLPDGDGLDLLAEIVDGIATPVIMVTGHGDERTAVKAFNQGAAGYVMKDANMGPMLAQEVDRTLRLQRAVAEKARADDLYRLLFENTGEPIYTYDRNLRFLDANRQAIEQIGYSKEELLGRNIFELGILHPDDVERALANARALLTGSEMEKGEYRYIAKNGETIYAEVTGTPLKDKDGNVVLITNVARVFTDRKMSEAELRHSEERYRLLQDNIAEIFYAYDAGLTLTDINTRATELLGYDREELLGRNILELGIVHPDDLAYAAENIAKVRAGEHIGRPRYRYLKKNGEALTVEVSASAVTDANGEFVGIASLAMDVTEESKSQEALLASERRYRALFQDNPCMLFTLSTDGTVVSVNEAGSSQLGYRAEELLGESVLKVFHEDDRDSVMGQLTECLRRPGEVFDWEFRKRRRDGSVIWVQEYVRAVEDEVEGLSVLVVCQDITERKRAEQRLESAKSQLESIIEFLPDATFIMDGEKKIIAWNRAIEEITGVPKEDILGEDHIMAAALFYGVPRRFLIDLLEADDEELASKYHFINRRGDTLYAETYTPALYGGKGAYVFATASPLYDADGRIIASIESIRDITEQKNVEKALQKELEAGIQREEELQAANRELQGFARTVSHDLKGPLTTTITGLDVLKGMLEDTGSAFERDDALEMIESVIGMTESCFNLIDELLALATTGQVPQDVSTVDIDETIRICLDSMAASIEQSGVKVEIEGEMGSVLASPTHVYQVFANLIGNAVRHNDSASPVVRVIRVDGTPERVHRFIVRDNGPGFPEKYLENLFVPFFKAEGGGTVLGLAIVDRVLQVYGGEIRAYNDGGAVMEFSFEDFTANRA